MGILKRITALAIGAAIMCTAVNTVFAEIITEVIR